MEVEALYVLTLAIILIAADAFLILKRVKPFTAVFSCLFILLIVLTAYSVLKISVVQVVTAYNATTNTTAVKEIYGANPFVAILLVPTVITIGILLYHVGRWLTSVLSL